MKKIISRSSTAYRKFRHRIFVERIKPNLPVRKKITGLPLLFFFLSGIGLGIGGYHILNKNQPSPEAKRAA
ncbi:MAG: hypothetical protein IPN49_12735 [Saprospiraceae bacterium]|nr:hypothetical protein [Saprospiraceae bacterium]